MGAGDAHKGGAIMTVALRRLVVSVVGHLPGLGRVGRLPTTSGEGRPAAARRSWLSVVA